MDCFEDVGFLGSRFVQAVRRVAVVFVCVCVCVCVCACVHDESTLFGRFHVISDGFVLIAFQNRQVIGCLLLRLAGGIQRCVSPSSLSQPTSLRLFAPLWLPVWLPVGRIVSVGVDKEAEKAAFATNAAAVFLPGCCCGLRERSTTETYPPSSTEAAGL